MRRTSCLLLAASGCLALALQACQQPPPQQAEQPKRKSFEESDSNYQPISQPASDSSAPVAAGNTGSSPQEINQGWKAAANAQGDAAKQQAAGEMLNKTREMADQSNKPPQ